MQKTVCVVALCVVWIAGASEAHAQMKDWEDRGFANLNVGGQRQSGTFTEAFTPVINGENGSITVPHTFGGGPLIDGSVGIRVWRSFGVGIGYSRSRDKETATLSALIPNPIVFNSLRAATASTGEMVHQESAVHVQLLWMMAISGKFDVAAIVGPSFITVKQDLFQALTTTEGAPPFGTVTIASVQTQQQSTTAPALSVGLDATYRVTRWVGAGAFVRFSRLSGGNVDLPAGSGDGQISVDAGGLQAGVGLRVRF